MYFYPFAKALALFNLKKKKKTFFLYKKPPLPLTTPFLQIQFFRMREFIVGKHIGGHTGQISDSPGNSCYRTPANDQLVSASVTGDI